MSAFGRSAFTAGGKTSPQPSQQPRPSAPMRMGTRRTDSFGNAVRNLLPSNRGRTKPAPQQAMSTPPSQVSAPTPMGSPGIDASGNMTFGVTPTGSPNYTNQEFFSGQPAANALAVRAWVNPSTGETTFAPSSPGPGWMEPQTGGNYPAVG